MKNILNNLKIYLVALAIILAIIGGAWFYVGSLMENLNKIKPDEGSAFSLNSPKTYDQPGPLIFGNVNQPATYNQPLILTLADFAISITPLNASPASAAEENNVVQYVNAFKNTDIVQTKYAYKIKEDIILKQPGHPAVFEYQIDLAQYDFKKDEQGNFIFYAKGHKDDPAYIRFAIPAPFMIDADGKKSSTKEVEVDLKDSGRLTLKPSAEWLKSAKYPVVLDPTIEISIINVHSSPQQGENWTIDFTTQGTADLKIIPNDQATIDDDEFVSLKCGGETRQPQILAGDVIYYPDWSCSETATVIHYTKKAGNHTLRFEFGGQVVYAYNSAATDSVVFRRVTETDYYTTPGSYSWTVPANITSISVVVDGAGGGGGGTWNFSGGGGGAQHEGSGGGGSSYTDPGNSNTTHTQGGGGAGGAGGVSYGDTGFNGTNGSITITSNKSPAIFRAPGPFQELPIIFRAPL